MKRFCKIITGLIVLFLVGCQGQPVQIPTPIVETRSTVVPTHTQMATSAPTATRLPINPPTLTQTPTLDAALVQPVPFRSQSTLPEGVSIHIYELGRPIAATIDDAFGYNEVLSILKDKSYLYLYQEDRGHRDVKRTATINDLLDPFGYHVKVSPNPHGSFHYFMLYQGEKLLLEGIDVVSPVSVNRSKTNFVMIVDKLSSIPNIFMVQKDSIEGLMANQEGRVGKYNSEAWPQYMGDDLIWATMQFDPNQKLFVIKVYRNDQVIYQTVGTMYVRLPLYGLWTYQDLTGDHWILEVLDHISIDGKSMNEQHGYQKSYMFHLLGGRPAYMFEKDGKFGLNLDGSEVMLPGDSTLHYACCYPAMLNPYFTDNLLAFFLLNDGDRYKYVEVVVQ